MWESGKGAQKGHRASIPLAVAICRISLNVRDGGKIGVGIGYLTVILAIFSASFNFKINGTHVRVSVCVYIYKCVELINLPVNSSPASFHVPFFVTKIDDGQTLRCII